ncbi:MAG: iron chelate uptake ABC transporter family permease subunit [Burkholderiaceae bacterium]|jgi:iron complex transport system permease protein|nr:iron chelate uptake ABC transporter family permease subunit [Burkholderiaceae bacterium]
MVTLSPRARPRAVLCLLAALALVAMAVFMVWGARGNWAFVLPFRGLKLAALVLVAYAIAVSTVLFQTVTGNRILTPSIMGFDALYLLIQTLLVFFFGSQQVFSMDARLLFALNVGVMVFLSILLFRWLFGAEARSLHLVVLVGIVFGIFFRSLTSFMQRVLDPNEFMVLQDRFFASFNSVEPTLLGISAVIVALLTVLGWRMAPALDVLGLGRYTAINLGLPYRRTVLLVLMLVSVQVSVSTALVGPITFFGLLVASLARALVGAERHATVLPAAVLLGIICLVGGQVVLERVFSFDTALSIIIEFTGGITFLILILRRSAR